MPTMPNHSLFEDDPVQYWKKRIEFENLRCQRAKDSLNIYKNAIRKSELISRSDKKELYEHAYLLKMKAIFYRDVFVKANKSILEDSKILKEISRIRK